MNYSINDLLKGAKIMASKAFGCKKEYRLKFNHEEDGCWYIDYPEWPFDHHNLMMVAGADRLCDELSDDDKTTYVDVVPSNTVRLMPDYACLVRQKYSISGGATYSVEGLPRAHWDVWLCPVTLFVLGKYPKYIYFKKSKKHECNA
jgi:hypothetical protein